MTDPVTRITALRRPPMLVSAARHGTSIYDRARILPRLLDGRLPTCAEETLTMLLGLEAGHEEARRRQEAGYSVARHVETLIALMAEARLLFRPRSAS